MVFASHLEYSSAMLVDCEWSFLQRIVSLCFALGLNLSQIWKDCEWSLLRTWNNCQPCWWIVSDLGFAHGLDSLYVSRWWVSCPLPDPWLQSMACCSNVSDACFVSFAYASHDVTLCMLFWRWAPSIRINLKRKLDTRVVMLTHLPPSPPPSWKLSGLGVGLE